MKDIERRVDSLEPDAALKALVPVIKKIFAHLDEDARTRFVTSLLETGDGDKLSSMVNLWLAECMDEGVDPTHMCQSLVHKVAQSKQLMAVTDPAILVLFENWLEELEDEVLEFLKRQPGSGPLELSENLGLSQSGASFLIAKLEREEKL